MIPYGPPTPIHLDGRIFFNDRQEHESVWHDSAFVAELDQDEFNHWQARKIVKGEWTRWIPMRSAAECRAFITSQLRTLA